jgi:cytochrome c oxidase subunit III
VSTIIAKPPGTGSGGGATRGWGGDDGGGSFRQPPASTSRIGMTFALAGVAMLFIALTSAYVVRHGLDPGWQFIRMPAVLPFNTVVLLASSITIERARRARTPGWLLMTLALGAVFVAGQFVAWGQLSAAGIYLGTNPHASFFYLLTGLHALHLVGGIAALGYVVVRMRAAVTYPGRALDVTALYWHFMDGLWVYLFVLLFAWK